MKLEFNLGSDHAVVAEPFTHYGITVPKGFKTDGASVPFGRRYGRYAIAATFHDYCYASAIVPREDADWYFYQLLLKSEVPRWRAWLMYKAVRLFGRSHYARE